MLGAPDCTPGYYNNEGQDPGPAAKYAVGYPAGATAYFRYIEDWRNDGQFRGPGQTLTQACGSCRRSDPQRSRR